MIFFYYVDLMYPLLTRIEKEKNIKKIEQEHSTTINISISFGILFELRISKCLAIWSIICVLNCTNVWASYKLKSPMLPVARVKVIFSNSIFYT